MKVSKQLYLPCLWPTQKNRCAIHPTTLFTAKRSLIYISRLICLVCIRQISRYTSHSIYLTHGQQEKNYHNHLL